MTPTGPTGQRDKNDELDLDLPALDGEEEANAEDDFGTDLPDEDESGDPFDDAAFGAGAGAENEELSATAAEGGWLDDSEVAATLDIGAIDLSIQPEGKVLEDDEPDRTGSLEDLIHGDETYVVDGGEEGPLADDEELKEEDLPELDADEDGEVPDDALFDRAVIGGDDELRWADRAWALTDVPAAPDDADESGLLAVPGDEPRDLAWKHLEESGRVMAAAFVPGDAVVLALATADRARAFLVRVQPDGEQRIIAEVDPRTEDDGSSCVVTAMRWDAALGCLVVTGSFGVHAYRPS